LPLRRVYVEGSGGTTELTRISSIRSIAPKSFTSNILGKYRATSYYLLPVALLSQHGRVIADFAMDRTGDQLASLDDSEFDYVKSDSDRLGSTPDRAALHDFVEQHFKNIALRD
jgi:hypothetical protein